MSIVSSIRKRIFSFTSKGVRYRCVHRRDIDHFPISVGASELARKWINPSERPSKSSSAEQTNKWAMQANERADEQMVQPSTHRFYTLSTHSRKDIPQQWSILISQTINFFLLFIKASSTPSLCSSHSSIGRNCLKSTRRVPGHLLYLARFDAPPTC